MRADEGMWLYNHFPKDAVKQKYAFAVTDEFLQNLQRAAVRVGAGSGAFVSGSGLVVTNQHLIASCLIQQGARGHDYLKDGFYGPSHETELRCPNLTVQSLTAIEDVTLPAAKKSGSTRDALRERETEMGRIKSDCAARSLEVCEIVSLFAGSRYQLYRWKPYSDVRVVFAPEQALAFFGRERDSITYLRYGLDVAFLRVYENGSPAATPTYLKWSEEPLKEGDLVFAAGSPQTTLRETTAAQLTFYRDTQLPLELSRLAARIRELNTFAAKSDENQRIAEPVLTDFLERYKALAGKLIGLRDDRLVGRKAIFDQKIRQAVERDPKLGTEAGKVWDQVATAYKSWAPSERAYEVLQDNLVPGRDLLANRQLQVALLTQYLEELKALAEKDKDVPIKAILAGKTPQQAAEELASSDRLTQALEEPAQRIRKKHDDLIGTLSVSAAEKIAQYRYRLFGDAEYPDGTGTPRVEFGTLKGYSDRAGVTQPAAATFGGLFFRRNNEGPYQVPQRWVDVKPNIDLIRTLDFVSTCDIGGGDPGAAVVNRSGELVGILFDGNLESLPSTYLYTEDQARGVSVATQGVVEALEKVYRADALLRELGIPSGS
jgi:hypothetical protein